MSSRTARGWLILILALGAALRLWLFTGYQASDDQVYIDLAWKLREGTSSLQTNPYASRVGLWVPMAGAFALFGISIFAAVFVNFLSSLATIFLGFALGSRLSDARMGLVAAMLVAFMPLNLHHATEVHADLPLSAWMGLSVLVWQLSERKPWLGFLGGGSLGMGHLTKEPAFFLIAVIAVLSLRSTWGRKRFLYLLAGFALVVAIETIVYALFGDPAFRLHATRGAHSEYMEKHFSSAAQIAHRLFLEVPLMMFHPMAPLFPFFGLFYVAFLPAAIHVWWIRDRAGRWALGWWMVLFIFICLTPSSLFPFRLAFVARPRTLEMLTLPAALVLARSVCLLLPTRRRIHVVLGLVALLVVNMAASIRLWSDASTARENLEEAHRFLSDQPAGVVVGDERTRFSLLFFDRFRPRHRYVTWNEAPPAEPAWVIVDHYWISHDRSTYGTVQPAWTQALPEPVKVHVPRIPASLRRGSLKRVSFPPWRLEIRRWEPRCGGD